MLKHQYIKYVFIALLLVGLWGWINQVLPPVFLFSSALLWLAVTAWGSFDVRSNYFAHVLYKGQQDNDKHVAITFDDGPTVFTPQVLNLLEKYDMKATFFCIGKQMEQHTEIARQIIEKGHTLGNHSYTHSDRIGFFSTKQMMQEISRTDKAIHRITGCVPRMYRPPFGVTNPNISKACKNTEKNIVGWNIRSLDTVITDENRILKRISSRLRSGDIILLHDTSDKSVRVLEQLLIHLTQSGYQSVQVDRLLEIEAYTLNS